MTKIRVVPGQRWLRSTGPRREDNVILFIIEVTPRRFFAVAHVSGVNAVGDEGPLLGDEAEKAPGLITESCLLMLDGETPRQCVVRHNPIMNTGTKLKWESIRADTTYPITARRGDTTFQVDFNSKHEFPFSVSYRRKHHKFTPMKARFATLHEAKSRCQ